MTLPFTASANLVQVKEFGLKEGTVGGVLENEWNAGINCKSNI
jgi:hypothetical protein